MAKKKRKSARYGQSGARDKLPPALPPAIHDILAWADKCGYPATLVGAVAVCLHGAVRPTDDIDLLVLTTDAPEHVLQSLLAAGYTPRYADPAQFAEITRVLLMRHSETGVDVDIMLGMLPFEHDCVARSILKRGKFGSVRIAAPETLCVMKLIAGRPHDLRDVAQLLELYPKLDRDWVLEHIGQYVVMMENPEVLERARSILSGI